MRLLTLKRIGISLTALLLLAGTASRLRAEVPASLVSDLNGRWSSLKSLQADLSVGFQMFGNTLNTGGRFWQQERLFRCELTVPQELSPNRQLTGDASRIQILFDGRTLWQSMPIWNLAYKFDLTQLDTRLAEEMTPASFQLPAISYSTSEKVRNRKNYYLLETRDVAGFSRGNQLAASLYPVLGQLPFKRIQVWVGRESLLPEIVEFYGSQSVPIFFFRLQNIKTGQALAPELFTFRMPEGSKVIDMTSSLAQLLKGGAATDSGAKPSAGRSGENGAGIDKAKPDSGIENKN
ncbi:MAG TPA: hypothetical protein PKM61_07860 [bacterium]|nr:hypothetical protein [bacterium]